MNLDRRTALDLVAGVRAAADRRADVDVAVFPPFVYLDEIARSLAGSRVRLGAQNMCVEDSGAFTGEVSAAMLRDVNCTRVILGHPERRQVQRRPHHADRRETGQVPTSRSTPRLSRAPLIMPTDVSGPARSPPRSTRG